MSGTAVKTLAVAALFFAASLVLLAVGWYEKYDPEDGWDWSFMFLFPTFWEFAAYGLFAVAVGTAAAALRLRRQ